MDSRGRPADHLDVGDPAFFQGSGLENGRRLLAGSRPVCAATDPIFGARGPDSHGGKTMTVHRDDEVQLFEAYTLEEIRVRGRELTGDATLNSVFLDSSSES
jgi:hypothetical protein